MTAPGGGPADRSGRAGRGASRARKAVAAGAADSRPRSAGASAGGPAARDPPASGAWIEIDEPALRHNIRLVRERIAPATLCMVVKANAYGHGFDPVVPVAQDEDVEHFAVFSCREAARFLRASTKPCRLQVMGTTHPGNLEWLAAHGAAPWLHNRDQWAEIQKFVADDGLDRGGGVERGTGGEGLAAGGAAGAVRMRVHLEVDTGMHRTGLAPDEAFEVAREAWRHDLVELEGVCTHLAGAESARNRDRVEAQKEVFSGFLQRLDEAGVRPPFRHLASSAAGLPEPESRLDMVRVGIPCYGMWPSPETARRTNEPAPLPIRRVMRFKSRVMDVREVEAGRFVGYGRAFAAPGDLRVATIPVGYGDGLARELGNRGHVLLHGRRCTIVGVVNMNMIQVLVDHLDDVRRGDEVVLIGRQGDHEITVASFAEYN